MFSKRCDMQGNSFEFPSCLLDEREYAKIVSEINNSFDYYRDKPFAIHYSVDDDGHYYMYYFENHGFDDYNIVEKIAF